MNRRDTEVVPLELPKDLIQEYRRIAKAEGLTGSEVVAWCLGYGFRAYAAGDRSEQWAVSSEQQNKKPDQ
jgi:hypothetical protein